MDADLPLPRFDHLVRMSDRLGLHEHATGSTPRRDLGYCTDDVSRGLILTTLAGAHPELTACYLRFLLAAVTAEGMCHNRLGPAGRWTDEAGLGDCWGRAVWALGVAIRAGDHSSETTEAFDLLVSHRSPFLRAMAYAALGAAEVVATRPSALELLQDAVGLLADGDRSRGWPWSEPRLGYDNAVLVHALLAAGDALDRPELIVGAVQRLEFLVSAQTHDGHLSVVPVGGRGPGEAPPAFDQQPIELASLANAGAAAHRLTGDPRWRDLVGAAAGWFVGRNDNELPMFDDDTGAGYDGLTASGRNLNQGAESTLAANFALLQAHRLGVSACPPPSPTTPANTSVPTRTE